MKTMKGNFLLILHLWLTLPIESMKISPCKVQKVELQPNHGISAKTKKPVDILQVPAFFTQNIQADICVDTDTTFSRSLLPNIPQFMCRQRYTIVEVYVKPQGELNAVSSEKISKEQKPNEFIKEFVFAESGCDIFINFPSVRFPETTKTGLKSTSSSFARASGTALGESIENVGIADINPDQILPIFDVLEVEKAAAAELNLDSDHNLKPRSMIKSDFFRKGMHLNSNANTTDNHRKPKMNPSHQSSNDNDTSSNSNSGYNTSSRKNDVELVEGEFRLNPENIGLPLLILEPAMDPIMKLLSHYSVK